MTYEEINLKHAIESHLSTSVLNIQRETGGLVHFVYRVTTPKQDVFVKIRKSHYSELPQIQTKPELIENEKKALEIAFTLQPDIFPKVLKYFQNQHALLLTDVMPEKRTLEQVLDEGMFTAKDAFRLGKILGTIHESFSTVRGPIRAQGDNEFYKLLLGYRLGFYHYPKLDWTVSRLEKQPKQLIVGDLSPKNIGFSFKNKFTICDLENCHLGNTISDIGFLLGGLILHTIRNRDLSRKIVLSFLKGYSSKIKIETQSLLIKRVALSTLLYRLDNKVIPYNIKLSKKEKGVMVSRIKKTLFLKNQSWKNLITAISI